MLYLGYLKLISTNLDSVHLVSLIVLSRLSDYFPVTLLNAPAVKAVLLQNLVQMRDLNCSLVVELLNLPVTVDQLNLRSIGFVEKAILVAN